MISIFWSKKPIKSRLRLKYRPSPAVILFNNVVKVTNQCILLRPKLNQKKTLRPTNFGFRPIKKQNQLFSSLKILKLTRLKKKKRKIVATMAINKTDGLKKALSQP